LSNYSTAIANEFIRRAFGRGDGLSQMQAQKLVFISHGWNLALNERPICVDRSEAWDYGPVFPLLYDHTKYFGNGPIPRQIRKDDDNPASFFIGKNKGSSIFSAQLSSGEKQVIGKVWARYGELDGIALSKLTHQRDTPWFNAYRQGRNTTIDNSAIRQHYEKIAENVGQQ